MDAQQAGRRDRRIPIAPSPAARERPLQPAARRRVGQVVQLELVRPADAARPVRGSMNSPHRNSSCSVSCCSSSKNSPASARLMPKRSAKCASSSLLVILRDSAIRVLPPLVFLAPPGPVAPRPAPGAHPASRGRGTPPQVGRRHTLPFAAGMAHLLNETVGVGPGRSHGWPPRRTFRSTPTASRIVCARRATVRGVSTETIARPRPRRLTQARIGDTLHDGNGTRVAIVNAFTTVNPETEATVRAVDYLVVGAAPDQFRLYSDDEHDVSSSAGARAFITIAGGTVCCGSQQERKVSRQRAQTAGAWATSAIRASPVGTGRVGTVDTGGLERLGARSVRRRSGERERVYAESTRREPGEAPPVSRRETPLIRLRRKEKAPPAGRRRDRARARRCACLRIGSADPWRPQSAIRRY